MYNKRSLSKDTKASKAPKSISKPKDIILDPMGQWKYPGQNTRIPGNDITMQGVNYPVLGVGSNGQEQMMYPGQDYKFQGAEYVDEYPQMRKGGGLKSKKFSRDLEATNYLFHESPLFKKPKSKKKKIFHPKAKHYQEGGTPEEGTREYQLANQPKASNYDQQLIDKAIEAAKLMYQDLGIYDEDDFLWSKMQSAVNPTEVFKLAKSNVYNDAYGKDRRDQVDTSGTRYHGSQVGTTLMRYFDAAIPPDLYPHFQGSTGYGSDIVNKNIEEPVRREFTQSAMPTLQHLPLVNIQYNTPEEEFVYKPPIKRRQTGGSTLTPEEEAVFQTFYNTLPDNLMNDDPTYDMRGYWDSEGRPEAFDYSQPTEDDGYYHAYSINGNTGEYLKSPAHETFQHAVDEDRKIGYRPITDVYGRNIVTENESIAEPAPTHFLNDTTGPANYIDLELTPEEIQQYRDGGYIVEDVLDYKQEGGEPSPESDWYKLSDAQKALLEKGNNLDVVKDWYKQNPDYMETFFKQWLDEHDAQTYLNQLDPNSEESKNFNEALTNNREWYQNWYSKRKELPQFKDIAEQRLALNNENMMSSLKDPVNLSMDWWKTHPSEYSNVPEVFYAPEIGAITRKNVADYNINQGHTEDLPGGNLLQKSYFRDADGNLQSSLITHEETHVRDHLAPQPNTKKNIKNNAWGQPGTLDPIEQIITSEEALADPRNRGYNNAYQQQPTEVRARLNVWRMKNGIDPLKNYTEEELKSIIEKDLQDPNLDHNIKELYETIKNDPSKLKFVHDSYVSNDSNKGLNMAKKGGSLLTKKVTCKKCGWKWDAADGGNDITTCHKCGGQGLVHAQKGGSQIYKYADRPEASYKKDAKGNWLISLPSTKGKYVPIKDPTGKRAGELNEKAKPLKFDMPAIVSAEEKYHDGPIESADWLWTLPIALPAIGQFAAGAGAMSLPGMSSVPGATLGNLVNSGFIANSLLKAPGNAKQWYDVSQGKKDWKDAALGSAEIAAGLFGSGPGWKSVVQDAKALGKVPGNTYNKIATGNSPLPIAWKVEKPTQAVRSSDYIKRKYTDEEIALLDKYGNGMWGLTPDDWAEMEKLTRSGVTDFSKGDYPISRVLGYYNRGTSARNESELIKNLKRGDVYTTPTEKTIRTWSAGVPSADRGFPGGADTRLVIPSRYTKNLGNNFSAMPYYDRRLPFIYAPNGTLKNYNAVLEKELMGNIPGGFKVIGKTVNDGKHTLFIKPHDPNKGMLSFLGLKKGGVTMGQEVDLTPEEEAHLRKLGYKLERI